MSIIVVINSVGVIDGDICGSLRNGSVMYIITLHHKVLFIIVISKILWVEF